MSHEPTFLGFTRSSPVKGFPRPSVVTDFTGSCTLHTDRCLRTTGPRSIVKTVPRGETPTRGRVVRVSRLFLRGPSRFSYAVQPVPYLPSGPCGRVYPSSLPLTTLRSHPSAPDYYFPYSSSLSYDFLYLSRDSYLCYKSKRGHNSPGSV